MLILFWFKKVRSALEQQVMLKLQSYQYQERALQGSQIRLPVSPYYYEVSHRCSIFDLSNEIPVLIWCTFFTAHTASFLGATKNKEEHGKKKNNTQLWQFFTVRLQFWKPQQLRFNDPEFGETFQELLFCSRSVVSDSLGPHGLQHARLPCPSPSPRACSNSCPFSLRCHPTISSSVVSFSSCLQYFPASGPFLMSLLFPSGGQSIRASASASGKPGLQFPGWTVSTPPMTLRLSEFPPGS